MSSCRDAQAGTGSVATTLVTHYMGFARTVADRFIFMEFEEIGEENEPHAFFDNPQQEKTRRFLSQIL